MHLPENLVVERLLQPMILRLNTPACNARRDRRIVENRREVETLGLPVIDGFGRIEHVDAAYHLVHRAETQLRHVLANLLCDKEKEINNVFGLPLELLAQN